MSSIALWTVKAPIAQIATITGATIENGTRRIAGEQRHRRQHDDQPGDVAQIHASRSGPRRNHAARRTAAAPVAGPKSTGRRAAPPRCGEPGMPRVIIGSSALVPAACAAVSGATTPSKRAGAETVAVLGEALGEAVAHERRRRRAARGDAHPAADDACCARTSPKISAAPSRSRHTTQGLISAVRHEMQVPPPWKGGFRRCRKGR